MIPSGSAIPPACSAVRRDLEAYVLGELDAVSARGLREHLRGCRECAAHGAEIAWILQDVRVALGAGGAGSPAAAAGNPPDGIRRRGSILPALPVLGSAKGLLVLAVMGLLGGAAARLLGGHGAGASSAGDSSAHAAARAARRVVEDIDAKDARREAIARLVATQDAGGSWNLENAPGAAFLDPGVTALAALALLHSVEAPSTDAPQESLAARRACERIRGFVGRGGVIAPQDPVPVDLRVPLQAACARVLAAAAAAWPEEAFREAARQSMAPLIRWQHRDGSFGTPRAFLPPDAFATVLAWSALDEASRAGIEGVEGFAAAAARARAALERFERHPPRSPGAVSDPRLAAAGLPESPFVGRSFPPAMASDPATPMPPERMLARALLARAELPEPAGLVFEVGIREVVERARQEESAGLEGRARPVEHAEPVMRADLAAPPPLLPAWREVLRLASLALAPETESA